jgi:hypothetical protein
MSPEPFFQIGTEKSASRQRFIAIEKGVYYRQLTIDLWIVVSCLALFGVYRW